MQRNETGLVGRRARAWSWPARLHRAGELTVYGRANCRLGGAGTEPFAFSMNTWRHSSINVREARPRDLEAIARLENELFESDRVSRRSLREFLRAPHRPVIAATIDDELAGYALVSLRKGARALRIYSLAVDGRFTRRGIGRALLRPARLTRADTGGKRSPSKCATTTHRRSRFTRAAASASSASTRITTRTGRPRCATKRPCSPCPRKRRTIRRRSVFDRCETHHARAREPEEARN